MKEAGRLLSQLLDFVVKLFVVKLWVEQADSIGSSVSRVSKIKELIFFVILTSSCKCITLLIVVHVQSYVPSLVVSPTVVFLAHGLVSSHVMEE